MHADMKKKNPESFGSGGSCEQDTAVLSSKVSSNIGESDGFLRWMNLGEEPPCIICKQPLLLTPDSVSHHMRWVLK